MNVQELIDALSELPRDMDVIIGSNEEGNDFLNVTYTPSVQWCVEDDGYRCGFGPVADEDIGTEYEEDELVQKVVM